MSTAEYKVKVITELPLTDAQAMDMEYHLNAVLNSLEFNQHANPRGNAVQRVILERVK